MSMNSSHGVAMVSHLQRLAQDLEHIAPELWQLIQDEDAVVSDGSFAVEPWQLALAPDRSGWLHPQGGETRWMGLFMRGGKAWEAFAHPRVGACLERIARLVSALAKMAALRQDTYPG